jgi:putative transposase
MKARYQYRIYPTQQQQTDLSRLFGCCRVVWNDALALVRCTPKGEKWPSNADLQKLVITQGKQTEERAWLGKVSNIPLQQSIQDLGVAFKNFFDSRKGKRKGRKIGFPKFKKRTNNQSARFRLGGFSLKSDNLYLARLGEFKVQWSRPLPSAPTSVTVIKNTAGQYHVSFVVEVRQIDVEPIRPSIGVDLGIKTFAFLSNGERVESPGYKRLDRKIRRFQRRLSRQVKGSKRYQQTRLLIAKFKLRVRNIRKDFLHKLSTKLVRENQTVSLEDLAVSNLVKNRKLARVISEQGWSEFRSMVEVKANTYKDRIASISCRWEPTSQICSACGFRWGKLDLSVRLIQCVSCNAVHDRDENAAKNINNSGVELSQESKWAMNDCKTRVSGSSTASPSRLLGKQLCLF